VRLQARVELWDGPDWIWRAIGGFNKIVTSLGLHVKRATPSRWLAGGAHRGVRCDRVEQCVEQGKTTSPWGRQAARGQGWGVLARQPSPT
jgi:hypothetical protein